MKIFIDEYFKSIQGEGPQAGIPSTFIRFSGCTLHCPYCDTKHAWKTNSGTELTDVFEKHLIDFVKTGPTNIVITGGEPLIHYKNDKFINLLKKLYEFTRNISFETTMIPRIDFIHGSRNITTTLNDMKMTDPIYSEFKYIISPKLSKDSYPEKVKFENVLKYYMISPTNAEIYSNSKQLFYKLIYSQDMEDEIIHFIDKLPSSWIHEFLYMMPMTPIPLNFKSVYIESCSKTIDFCIKNDLKYSPRLHIDVYGNERGF